MTNSEDIKKSVLEKITRGEVHMRPRIYFIIKIISVIVVAALALFASALVVSFAFFSIHESGELFLLGFGARGLTTFLSLFPWGALIVAILLIVLLEWLLKHFRFTYRVPLLNMIFSGLFLVILIGLLITVTPFHAMLLDKADKGELPIVGELYESIHMPHEDQGEFRGVVMSMSSSTLTITHNDNDADADDGTRTVVVPANFDTSQVKVGDRVYVAGDMASGTVSAYGVQRF